MGRRLFIGIYKDDLNLMSSYCGAPQKVYGQSAMIFLLAWEERIR